MRRVKTTWKRQNDIKRDWFLVDAEDQILGRVATQVATLLIGKGKVDQVPNMDCGDYVVVINAEKILVTGKKMSDKKYVRHSGYPGGLKEKTLEELLASDPEKAIWHAVRNMLPQTKHRSSMMSRLMVYAGSEHPHEAQKPEPVKLISKK